MTARILLASLTAALCSCNLNSTGVIDRERVLVEIEYINFATTPTYFGFFVAANGVVYRYDRNGQPWINQDAQTWTFEELDDKFVPIRTRVDERNANEISGLEAPIAAAAGGARSTLKSECADVGTLTYRAYLYNAEDRRYTPVFLRVQGDIAQQNTTQAAQQLIAYIRSLALIPELASCEP